MNKPARAATFLAAMYILYMLSIFLLHPSTVQQPSIHDIHVLPETVAESRNFRAAFAVLLKFEHARPRQNLKILSMLYTLSVQWERNYPVYLFHNDRLPMSFKEEVMNCSEGMPLVWYNISELMDSLQGGHNKSQSERWSIGLDGGSPVRKPPGYRAMCQFWSNEVFHLPQIRDLDLMIRLDDDSWFANKVTIDPVKVFGKNEKLGYGFSMYYYNAKRSIDHMGHNLLKYAKEFAGEDIIEKALSRNSSLCPVPDNGDTMLEKIIYNNFFITRPQLWTQGIIRNFYAYVKSRDGFLKDGIGDAEFHTVAICLLDHYLNPDHFIKRFSPDAFPYRHKNERPSKTQDGDRELIVTSDKHTDYWADYVPSVGCRKVPMVE